MLSHNEKSGDLPRTNVLGIGVSSINMDEAVEILLDARAHGRTGYVCVTGVHGVIESQRDPELKKIHNRSFLTVPDGMPTVWMGREQGFVRMGRVYGPDLMLEVCERSTYALKPLKSPKTLKSGQPTSPVKLSAVDAVPSTSLNESNGFNESKARFNADDTRPFTHFLYGSTPEVLEKLKANLEKRFPGIRIVGTFSPPFRPLTEDEEHELQKIVSDCKPDFFWVGLSTPKQERFMYAHSASMKTEDGEQRSEDGGRMTEIGEQIPDADPRLADSGSTSHVSRFTPHPLDFGIMLGVGAAFDIHAGLLKDAPEWVKNSGLQWFYRLCQEPKRLWRRYLDIVPRFLWLAFLQVLGVRKYTMED